MSITVYSFLMAILWCDVFIIISTLLRRNGNFFTHFNVTPLLFLMFAGMFRLLVTVEIPFSHVVESRTIFPAIQSFVRKQLFTVPYIDAEIQISTVLLAVWIGVSVYLLLKCLIQYYAFNKMISGIPGVQDEKLLSVLDEIVSETKPGTSVKIIALPSIKVPAVTGISKPTIFMPDMQYPDAALRHILLHEWNHFLHKDAWIKLLTHIICSVFWWNPLVYLLKSDLDHTLEIKCDLNLVAKMSETERLEYLSSVLTVIKGSQGHKSSQGLPMFAAGMASANSRKKIKQRFLLTMHATPQRSRKKRYTLLLCFVIVLFFSASYLFVIQPASFPTNEPEYEEFFNLTSDNAYLVDNGDGSYTVYVNGQRAFTVNDTSIVPYSSLPINE